VFYAALVADDEVLVADDEVLVADAALVDDLVMGFFRVSLKK
jgi:hypothetical protein